MYSDNTIKILEDTINQYKKQLQNIENNLKNKPIAVPQSLVDEFNNCKIKEYKNVLAEKIDKIHKKWVYYHNNFMRWEDSKLYLRSNIASLQDDLSRLIYYNKD